MKKQIPPFLAGALCVVLVLTLCGTALAASGRISYNFADIAVDGQRKISAGDTITAQNGQQVPASILYTDEAGGKTNYLPVRTICDLLGVKIDYDSATKTIHLGDRSEQREGWRWRRELDGVHVNYVGQEETGEAFLEPPAWRPTALPAGWLLEGVSAAENGNNACGWSYQNGEKTLEFSAYRLSGAHVGTTLRAETAYRAASVGERPADFYMDENRNLLVWEGTDGTLFQLSGPLEQAALEQIAASVSEIRVNALPEYRLEWLPQGGVPYARSALREAVREQFRTGDGVICSWMYAAEGVGPLAVPERESEIVAVNGGEARFWQGDPAAGGGIAITSGSTGEVRTLPGRDENAVLLWTDPNTAITFRIQGRLDKEVLVRMAESVSRVR